MNTPGNVHTIRPLSLGVTGAVDFNTRNSISNANKVLVVNGHSERQRVFMLKGDALPTKVTILTDAAATAGSNNRTLPLANTTNLEAGMIVQSLTDASNITSNTKIASITPGESVTLDKDIAENIGSGDNFQFTRLYHTEYFASFILARWQSFIVHKDATDTFYAETMGQGYGQNNWGTAINITFTKVETA